MSHVMPICCHFLCCASIEVVSRAATCQKSGGGYSCRPFCCIPMVRRGPRCPSTSASRAPSTSAARSLPSPRSRNGTAAAVSQRSHCAPTFLLLEVGSNFFPGFLIPRAMPAYPPWECASHCYLASPAYSPSGGLLYFRHLPSREGGFPLWTRRGACSQPPGVRDPSSKPPIAMIQTKNTHTAHTARLQTHCQPRRRMVHTLGMSRGMPPFTICLYLPSVAPMLVATRTRSLVLCF